MRRVYSLQRSHLWHHFHCESSQDRGDLDLLGNPVGCKDEMETRKMETSQEFKNVIYVCIFSEDEKSDQGLLVLYHRTTTREQQRKDCFSSLFTIFEELNCKGKTGVTKMPAIISPSGVCSFMSSLSNFTFSSQ